MPRVLACTHCGTYAHASRFRRSFAFADRCPECALPRTFRRRIAS